MSLEQLKEILDNHKMWFVGKEGGKRANLEGAYLDFSCLPLWCGSLSAHFDDNQIIQIVYHAVKAGLNSKNVSEEVKVELSKAIGLANRFHRAEECGRIETEAKIAEIIKEGTP